MSHYETLGVSVEATPDEVDKAYRQLARALHPDTNPDPQAGARLAVASASYAVLSDPDQRAEYDRRNAASQPVTAAPVASEQAPAAVLEDGPSWVHGDGGERVLQSTQQGGDIYVKVPLDAHVASAGGHVAFPVAVYSFCAPCLGSGRDLDGPKSSCLTCSGLRTHPVTGQPCADCSGLGSLPTQPCLQCNGSGAQPTIIDLEVFVPANTTHLAHLQFPRRGVATPAGRSGDLHVQVHIPAEQRQVPSATIIEDVQPQPSAPSAPAEPAGQVPHRGEAPLVVSLAYPDLVLGGEVRVVAHDGTAVVAHVGPGTRPGDLVEVQPLDEPATLLKAVAQLQWPEMPLSAEHSDLLTQLRQLQGL